MEKIDITSAIYCKTHGRGSSGIKEHDLGLLYRAYHALSEENKAIARRQIAAIIKSFENVEDD